MNKHVLVSGATGFIGSHLVKSLKQKNHVIILARDLSAALWGKWLNEALQGCTLIHGDILDQNLIKRILAEYQVTHVYHLAAQAIVKTALQDPIGTFQANIMGTASILEACRQVGVEKVLVMSTDKVYGNKVDVSESVPLDPTGIYETSKLCADSIAQSYIKTFKLPICIARPCNCYGYDLNPRIIPNTIIACLNGQQPIIYKGEQTTRQYIYVEDLVSALTFIVEKPTMLGPYNIATPDILSQEEVVLKICEQFGIKPKYVERAKPIYEIHNQNLDWSALLSHEWAPLFPFADGIKATIEKFKTYGIPYYMKKEA